MKTAAQLVAEGYGGYAGWSDPEAGYDFRATGGAGKKTSGGGGTSSQTVEQQASAILDAQKAQIDQETKFLDQYLVDNPFVFDEQLARDSATQEYQPYYSEILQDYLGEVQAKRTTVQDERKLLTDLRRADLGQRSLEYERAVSNAEQGFAGQGMFFSGIKQKALGQGEVAEKLAKQRGEIGYQGQQLGLTREEQDLARAEEQKRRDIFGGATQLGGLAQYGERGGLYQTALEGGIEQRRGEQVKGYLGGREAAYMRRYPTGSLSSTQGYLVPEYLRY